MRRVLHIFTATEKTFAEEIAARQRRQPDLHVEVIDLTAPEPDYQALLNKIFENDSVQVW